ncbi:diguanylate cyclase domain-containing protein [Modicisalibacter radicis]|uniref:diguanylate cyclase domain-containing protein n=1 Tax=Halomonas sp. EAR18 TaxID=2518972 RepID=UPI00109BFC03|nr:diguanylate cyclase [Halomonas sp. EAR18]
MAYDDRSRLADWLFRLVYVSGVALMGSHALWQYMMGHYGDILLPATLTLLLGGALFVRWVNPEFRRLSIYLMLISCYLIIATDLVHQKAVVSLFWLGMPPVLTMLVLPLAPGLLLSLFLTPVWLAVATPGLALGPAALAYLALVGMAALPGWVGHRRAQQQDRSVRRDRDCEALSRETLERRLGAEVERARALKRPFATLVIHLPQLEMADEQFGRPLLHVLLDRICQTIQANSRQHDLLGREQASLFWLLLPDTGEAGALIVRERLLHALNREVIAETGTLQARIRVCRLHAGETRQHFEQRLLSTGLKLMEPVP